MTRTVVGMVVAGVLAAAVGVWGQAPAAGPPPTAPNPATCEGQPGAGPAPAAEGRGRGAGRGGAAAAPASTAPRAVTVPAIPGVIAAGATWTQVWQTTGNNADGIVAMPTDGSLLVNQEDNSAVVRLDAHDQASIFLSDTHGSGSLSFNTKGQLLAVQRLAQPNTPAFGNPSAPRVSGIAMLWPMRQMVADTFVDGTKLMGRPNDLSADSLGGAYFSQGCVYYASAAGKVTLVAEHIRSNGIVLSGDEKTLYVTNGGTLSVFDAPEPGKLTNRREWTLEAGGNGDGTEIDAAGRVYVASGPGVQVFSPQGKYLGLIPTPSGLTGEAFAGPAKKTLYVVAAGSTDADGKPSTNGGTGRTIYRIPMIAEGFKGRSK